MIAFIYTNNKTSEKNKENNPNHNNIKNNKILMNKFDQGGENMYTENYKTL